MIVSPNTHPLANKPGKNDYNTVYIYIYSWLMVITQTPWQSPIIIFFEGKWITVLENLVFLQMHKNEIRESS